jgi:hypothetical protein
MLGLAGLAKDLEAVGVQEAVGGQDATSEEVESLAFQVRDPAAGFAYDQLGGGWPGPAA